MADKVICWVKPKSGKWKKYASKNGANFKDRKGNDYTAPNADNHEILEVETIWGRKLQAFYAEGHANAKPLSQSGLWKKSTNHDSDVDILIRVTKAALMEANLADLKANASLLGLGVIGLGLLAHHFLG